MRHILTILIVTLLLTGSVVAGNSPATEAAALLRKVTESPAARNYPEEFNNFAATVTAAKKLLQEGDNAGAGRLFSLALLKGEILFERGTPATVPRATAEPPQSLPLSSSANTVPPAPLLQIDPPFFIPPEEPVAFDPGTARILSARIVGGGGVYIVKRKERLKLVASRLGVRSLDLARMNRLKTDATVYAGQSLRYNNRRIVPKSIRDGIIVNIPDRNLYLFRNGRLFANYPVALGISRKDDSTIWRTPTGRFRIVDKKENPVWRIPPSIQKEMEENGEEVVETVQPGPKNPLGKYAMRTDLSGILIHSTTRPASINSYSSHGCIRVMPEHMERLFKSVKIPTEGEIIYQPVKVEVTADGKIFLEVNRDSYEQIVDLSAEVKRMLKKHRAASRVSWQRVNQVVTEKSGIAEDVTLEATAD